MFFFYLEYSVLRKFTMRSHMTLGGLAILCSPIQMVTPFTVGWNKSTRRFRNSSNITNNTINWYRRIHKFSGRFYVLCAIGSFCFGQWFICLKEFVLVGGYNMGVSFSLAGFFIAYSAYMTWKTAPGGNQNNRYTIEDHRNWAIRSFSQIIAPVLYRFWYIFMMVLKVYRMPFLAGGDRRGKLDCDGRDVCPDYQRPLDSVYAWMYWIGAWMVAELVIICLPPHQSSQKAASAAVSTTTNKTLEARNQKEEVSSLEQPLLASQSDDESTSPTIDSESTSTTSSTESDERREENSPPSHQVVMNDKEDASLPLVVNFVGCLLAVLSATVVVPVLIMTFKKK